MHKNCIIANKNCNFETIRIGTVISRNIPELPTYKFILSNTMNDVQRVYICEINFIQVPTV